MPASGVTMKLIVLWADEVRLAAQALKRFDDAQREATSDNQMEQLLRDALNACFVALHGADDESATLLLTAMPKPDRKPSKRTNAAEGGA